MCKEILAARTFDAADSDGDCDGALTTARCCEASIACQSHGKEMVSRGPGKRSGEFF